ncbi:MAG: histidine utilization repressor [Desulfosarcinaceae bacterium]|nr:histidine utilization repressor [Desulfosarcinaceae bacterium]
MISPDQAPRALYIQVKEYILARIDSGEWQPDERIPSENQLVDDLNVSRMTVNRALRELAAEGRLVRVQGVGSFVARPKPVTTLFEIQSIDDEVRGWGGVYTCDIHLLAEERAYPELAAAMGIPVGAPIFHSIIVHRDRGRPVLLGDRYVNPVVAPDYLNQDFTRITPTNYLLKVAPVTKVEHIIEAVRPDGETCRLLEMGADEPCLVLHRQTWNARLVSTHSRFTYPGSRYRIGGRFTPVVHSANPSPRRLAGGGRS